MDFTDDGLVSESRVAAHKNNQHEYVTCVDLAMDALNDRRLITRALGRLAMFGARGTHEQREHIARLIERLAP